MSKYLFRNGRNAAWLYRSSSRHTPEPAGEGDQNTPAI
jgi:hypothetical protein